MLAAVLPGLGLELCCMEPLLPYVATAGLVLGRDYPAPIVRHDEARQRTLLRYAAARGAKD